MTDDQFQHFLKTQADAGVEPAAKLIEGNGRYDQILAERFNPKNLKSLTVRCYRVLGELIENGLDKVTLADGAWFDSICEQRRREEDNFLAAIRVRARKAK